MPVGKTNQYKMRLAAIYFAMIQNHIKNLIVNGNVAVLTVSKS